MLHFSKKALKEGCAMKLSFVAVKQILRNALLELL